MRRDRRLIIFFALITLLSGSVVGYHLATSTGPPVQAIRTSAPVGADGRFTLQFVGDTMLGAEAQPVLNRRGYDWPFRRLRKALDGDFTIANAETSFTLDRKPFNPAKEYFYTSRPAAVGALSRAGIDAIDLGNNHAMDAGPDGLHDSLRHARAAGLPAFGAGPNLARAERPLLLRTSAGTVGVVALGEDYGSTVTAEDRQAGTVDLSPETVQRGVDLARAAGADWVVAFMHWGDNYMPVNRQQRYWARTLAAAGYDLVVGAGPHITQPIRTVRSVPVVYSLGNYVFGTPGGFESAHSPGMGLILNVEFRRNRDPRLSVRCVRVDNEHVDYAPWQCNPTRSAKWLPRLSPYLRMRPDGSAVIADNKQRAAVPTHRKLRTFDWADQRGDVR